MSYLPEGVKAENLLNNIRIIGQKVSHVLNNYSKSNLNFNEFREKLDIKNIKNAFRNCFLNIKFTNET